VLHHLTLWVPDLGRAEESWGWLLGHAGFELDASIPKLLLFRDGAGFTLALEQSDDMVPGMLFSRWRPGLNHLALTLTSPAAVAAEAGGHGWTPLPTDLHPIAGGAEVAYLEDRDGFEVELVAPVAAGVVPTA
jgi:catechol 2,3-dioxygenase-like lactoylglutathione lyase family enzyme